MGRKLGRLDYWLLDVVAEHAVPLQALPAGEIELALNRPSLGASNHEVARCLARLRDMGLVDLHLEEDRTGDVAAIERLVSKPPRDGVVYQSGNHYRLTPTGGAEWERAARPDWGRYVERSEERHDDGAPVEHEILSPSAARAEAYLDFVRGDRLWYGPVSNESIARDVIRPWEATYWKTLPEGHRIRFRTGPGPERMPTPDEMLRRVRWDDRWHDDPWEGR